MAPKSGPGQPADPWPEMYLSGREFAGRYHVSTRTAQRWRTTGEGGPPFVRLGRRRVVYRVSDCEAWAAARTYEHRAAEIAQAIS
jgi:predicted DNA-binding transcriptional regulator AlpA